MSAQWDPVGIRPLQHAVNDRVIRLVWSRLHLAPFQGYFRNSDVEVLEKCLLVLSLILVGETPVKGSIRQRRAEPEFMGLLFDVDCLPRIRFHNQDALPV